MTNNNCIRCGSKNTLKATPKTDLRLVIPKENRQERLLSPTDALICEECGHIELFFDWAKANQ